MPRAADTATALTGITGQNAQRIPSFKLSDGTVVAAYVTKPNEDDVDGRNPLHAIWSQHATSDDARIARWEPTAQRMQPGRSKHKFFVAAAHCKTVGELRRVWEGQGRPWRLWKFLFASRWILFTIDTAAARLDYARLKAAIEGRPAPAPAPVPISEPAVEMIVSEDEAEDVPAPAPPAEESDDYAPLHVPEGDEGDEDDEPPPPVDEEDVAEDAPPPLENEEDEDGQAPADDDDDMDVAPPPAKPLFSADDRVWATDGATQYPATVMVDCKVGAETVRISWLTGRVGEYDWPISAVMRELPPRRPRREEAPPVPRRAKAPPAPRPRPAPQPPRVTTFRVGDKVEARYLGDLGGWCAGKVAAINADGSFVIDFDDGDRDSNVRPCHVQAPRPPPAPIITNKRPPPRQRTEPAEKRARPAPPPPQPVESDEELEAPPPPEEADDEGMPPLAPFDDEGEESDDEPTLPVKIAASPTGTITVTPLQEGEDDDDDVQPLPRPRSKTSHRKRRAKPIALTTAPLESDDDEDDGAPVPQLREEDAVGPAAVPPFRVGDEVEARWNYREGGLTWYLARIAAVHRDGSCDVAYDDGDFETRVAPNLIRTPFDVEKIGDACDLSEGARCFALFDDPENYGGQDVWGGTILNAWTQRGGLSHGHKRLRVVFDDGSIHSPWASEVARAVTPSIARSTLRIDRPGHKARRLIARAPVQLRAIELGAGCARLSYWLSKDGVLTRTVDFDPNCNADDQRDFLELPLDYLIGNKIIHISMDCFTFSFLAGTKHRTQQNPEGHSPEAARANREFAHLRAMCERAKAVDPNVLLSFENPVGMMELTEGAREGLEKGLGLTKPEVSYCKFAFGAGSPYVKKPTHFWTNSPLLIANFGDGKFTCSKYGCSCGDGYHRRVRPEAGQGDQARDHAAFPDELARFYARMLITDARARY